MGFAILTVAVIFLFQVVLLEPMYERSKIQAVKDVSESVIQAIENGNDSTVIMSKQQWTIEEDLKMRLDKYLSENSDLSRTRVQELAKAGEIFVNGKAAKSSAKLNLGDVIECDVPEDEQSSPLIMR